MIIFTIIGVIVVVWIIFDWFSKNRTQSTRDSDNNSRLVISDHSPMILGEGYYLLHYTGQNTNGVPVESTMILLFTTDYNNVFVQAFNGLVRADTKKLKEFMDRLESDDPTLSFDDYSIKGDIFQRTENKIRFEIIMGGYVQRLTIEADIGYRSLIVSVGYNDFSGTSTLPLIRKASAVYVPF